LIGAVKQGELVLGEERGVQANGTEEFAIAIAQNQEGRRKSNEAKNAPGSSS
jgi:hypothetical protein